MSVIKAERTEGKLVVITKSLDLVSYTIHICKNEGNFPKRDRWLLTNDIVTDAKEQFRCIRMANAVNVQSLADYTERHLLQVRAYGHLESLLSFIDIAFKEFSLPSDRVEFWVGKVIETEKLLQKWTQADKERYDKP